MVRVLLVLLASLIAAPIVETSFLQDHIYELNYYLYCAALGLVYLLIAYLSLRLANYELGGDRYFNCFLILTLCFCMLITGLLNLVMANKELYYLLKPWKSGVDGFTWKNIYLSVEVLVGFFVISSGINSLVDLGVCRPIRYNGTIRDNDNFN